MLHNDRAKIEQLHHVHTVVAEAVVAEAEELDEVDTSPTKERLSSQNS